MEWVGIDAFLSDWLERPFNEEEIKEAVFDCDGSKASGLDGYSMMVIQAQWDIVKVDILKVFGEFYRMGIINDITNETYICLIPKKINSCRVRDFGLISLVISLYKIIAKVLAKRLQVVLGKTISQSQETFVAGRDFRRGISG